MLCIQQPHIPPASSSSSSLTIRAPSSPRLLLHAPTPLLPFDPNANNGQFSEVSRQRRSPSGGASSVAELSQPNTQRSSSSRYRRRGRSVGNADAHAGVDPDTIVAPQARSAAEQSLLTLLERERDNDRRRLERRKRMPPPPPAPTRASSPPPGSSSGGGLGGFLKRESVLVDLELDLTQLIERSIALESSPRLAPPPVLDTPPRPPLHRRAHSSPQGMRNRAASSSSKAPSFDPSSQPIMIRHTRRRPTFSTEPKSSMTSSAAISDSSSYDDCYTSSEDPHASSVPCVTGKHMAAAARKRAAQAAGTPHATLPSQLQRSARPRRSTLPERMVPTYTPTGAASVGAAVSPAGASFSTNGKRSTVGLGLSPIISSGTAMNEPTASSIANGINAVHSSPHGSSTAPVAVPTPRHSPHTPTPPRRGPKRPSSPLPPRASQAALAAATMLGASAAQSATTAGLGRVPSSPMSATPTEIDRPTSPKPASTFSTGTTVRVWQAGQGMASGGPIDTATVSVATTHVWTNVQPTSGTADPIMSESGAPAPSLPVTPHLGLASHDRPIWQGSAAANGTHAAGAAPNGIGSTRASWPAAPVLVSQPLKPELFDIEIAERRLRATAGRVCFDEIALPPPPENSTTSSDERAKRPRLGGRRWSLW